jgi:hypothetical protein
VKFVGWYQVIPFIGTSFNAEMPISRSASGALRQQTQAVRAISAERRTLRFTSVDGLRRLVLQPCPTSAREPSPSKVTQGKQRMRPLGALGMTRLASSSSHKADEPANLSPTIKAQALLNAAPARLKNLPDFPFSFVVHIVNLFAIAVQNCATAKLHAGGERSIVGGKLLGHDQHFL